MIIVIVPFLFMDNTVTSIDDSIPETVVLKHMDYLE